MFHRQTWRLHVFAVHVRPEAGMFQPDPVQFSCCCCFPSRRWIVSSSPLFRTTPLTGRYASRLTAYFLVVRRCSPSLAPCVIIFACNALLVGRRGLARLRHPQARADDEPSADQYVVDGRRFSGTEHFGAGAGDAGGPLPGGRARLPWRTMVVALLLFGIGLTFLLLGGLHFWCVRVVCSRWVALEGAMASDFARMSW